VLLEALFLEPLLYIFDIEFFGVKFGSIDCFAGEFFDVWEASVFNKYVSELIVFFLFEELILLEVFGVETGVESLGYLVLDLEGNVFLNEVLEAEEFI